MGGSPTFSWALDFFSSYGFEVVLCMGAIHETNVVEVGTWMMLILDDGMAGCERVRDARRPKAMGA